MKKTVLFLLAAGFVFALTLGGFAAQDQTPPPVKPAPPTIVAAKPTPPAPRAVMTAPAKPSPRAIAPIPAAIASPTAPAPVAVAFAAEPPLPEQTPPPQEIPAAAARPEQTAPAKTPPPAQAPMPAKPEKAPTLRTEMVQLKYADPFMLQSILHSYMSPWGKVSPTRGGEQTIVVTDTPEIVQKMLSIISDIDVKPVEIQFTVQVVQGMDVEGQGDEALKNDPVIRELRGVLKYKSFSLLDGTLMRVLNGEEAEAKIGTKGEYTITLQPRYAKDGALETIQTRIRFRKPEWISQQTTNTDKKEETKSMQMYFNDLVSTVLQLKVGEKTVVGVSKNDADRGLILILSAKVIR